MSESTRTSTTASAERQSPLTASPLTASPVSFQSDARQRSVSFSYRATDSESEDNSNDSESSNHSGSHDDHDASEAVQDADDADASGSEVNNDDDSGDCICFICQLDALLEKEGLCQRQVTAVREIALSFSDLQVRINSCYSCNT
jgi:hypothetical protein